MTRVVFSDTVSPKLLRTNFTIYGRGVIFFTTMSKCKPSQCLISDTCPCRSFVKPPRPQQDDIVAEIEKQFSRLDEAVASLKRIKANLKRYKASVLKAAVEGKLTEDWRKQHPNVEPASKLLERILAERRAKWNGRGKYKEPTELDTSDLPTLPKMWTWASLDQVCPVERGRFSIRPRNDPRYYGGKHPFVQIGDLPREGGIIKTYSQTLNDAGLGVSKKFPSGTVLIAIVGATIAIYPEFLASTHAAQTAWLPSTQLTSWDSALSNSTFAPESWNCEGLPTLLEASRISTWLPSSPYSVPLPPIAEQHFIVTEAERRLSVIDELEVAIEANLTRADRLRQSILGQAFTGELLFNGACG